jgi:hypothetical protein
MSPVFKAIELIKKYEKYLQFKQVGSYTYNLEHVKKCALIAVNEILEENSIRGGENDEIIKYEPYWQEVKHEIEQY